MFRNTVVAIALTTSCAAFAQPSGSNSDSDLNSLFFWGFNNASFVDAPESAAVDSNGNYLVLGRIQTGAGSAHVRRVDRYSSNGNALNSITLDLPVDLDRRALVEPVIATGNTTVDSPFVTAQVRQFGVQVIQVCKKLSSGAADTSFGISGQNDPGCVSVFAPGQSNYTLAALKSVNYPAPAGQFRLRLILGFNAAQTNGKKLGLLASLDTTTGAIDTSFGTQGVVTLIPSDIGLTALDYRRVGISTSTLYTLEADIGAPSFIYSRQRNVANGADIGVGQGIAVVGQISSAVQALGAGGKRYVGFTLASSAGIGLLGFLGDALDLSFGVNGLAGIPTSPPPVELDLAGMGVTSSGKILIAGSTFGVAPVTRLLTARFTPQGKPDKRFNANASPYRSYSLTPATQALFQAPFANDQMMLVGNSSVDTAPPGRDYVLLKLNQQQDIFDDGFED